jgi:hypothetical protein
LNDIRGFAVLLRHSASPLFAAKTLAPMVRALVRNPVPITVQNAVEAGAQAAI